MYIQAPQRQFLDLQLLGGPIPKTITDEGPHACLQFAEFFAAQINNLNTRQAYARAVLQFFAWCESANISLHQLSPIFVAAYLEELKGSLSAPTVKQHLAAIRMCFDWLVIRQVLPMNPAASVRGPKHVVKRGKTPVLSSDEAKALLESIETSTIVGLRDRAIVATMIFTFARVSAVVGMKVSDFYQNGRRSWVRLLEKGGKHHEVPVNHRLDDFLHAYIDAAGIKDQKHGPLFRSCSAQMNTLSLNPLSRVDVYRMVRSRARRAGIESRVSCHSFRATGITAYLANGGTIEKAQAIAAHESPRTTKLYDRNSDTITLDEVERIVL